MTIMNLPATTLNDFYKNIDDLKTLKQFELFLTLSKKLGKNKLLLAQGGYAVDLAVGYMTRTHDDLDVAVLTDDLPYFRSVMIQEGFEIEVHEGMSPSTSFYGYRWQPEMQDRIYVDFDGIQIANNQVWDGEGETKFIWPITADELVWQRTIEGVQVRFCSPEIVYQFKKMQQAHDTIREKESKDFELLERAYPQLTTDKPSI